MDVLLKQCIEHWNLNIKENQSTATWSSAALVDNGYGTMIPDPDGTTVDYSETVRLSHEESGVNSNEETPAGLGTSYTLFMAMSKDTNIAEGLTLTIDSKTYTVGAVDTMRRASGIYGYQAPLTEVS